MYKIEKENFGYRLTFSGFIREDEMLEWAKESKKAVVGAPKDFGVLIDMKDLKPLPADSQKHMQDGQKIYKEKGMLRSAVIVNGATTKMQFQRIAKETGIYDWERYIDSTSIAGWEKVAIDWVSSGVDPDN